MYANFNAMQNNCSAAASCAEAAAFACALTVLGFAVVAKSIFAISVLLCVQLLAVAGIIRISTVTA